MTENTNDLVKTVMVWKLKGSITEKTTNLREGKKQAHERNKERKERKQSKSRYCCQSGCFWCCICSLAKHNIEKNINKYQGIESNCTSKTGRKKKNLSCLKFVSSTFSFFFHENEESHISLLFYQLSLF